MTRVTSIRLPAALAQELRTIAITRRMSVSALIAWILDLALADGLDLSRLPDAHEPLDGKLDLRLSDEMVRRILPVCTGLRMSVSVYIRTILYGGYTGQLVIKQAGGRYTLVNNHDQN
jgi:hypothetical protein